VWGRTTRTLRATHGDRLALHQIHFRGNAETGDFEIDDLEVTEIDAEGRIVAAIVFDPDERRAAAAEMSERSLRQGDAPTNVPGEIRRGIRDRDLARVRTLLPAGFVYHDHRSIGAGRLESAGDYVAWLAALFEGSPDATIEPLYFIASERHASLAVGHTFGTLADGGAFESVYAQVIGPFGIELFDLEDLDRARARFEELRPDPLRIPPNAATRAADRIRTLLAEGDWPALRALTTRDFAFDDRRKRALLSGDVELYVRNLQVVRSYPNLKNTRELLGTLGDRISVERVVYTGGPEGSAFEGEFLLLTEVDAAGRVRILIHFDPEDRAAAFAEAQARFVAGEAAGIPGQAAVSALVGAVARHDWAALRACFTDDARIEDHRSIGLFALDVDAWIDSLRALTDLAGDMTSETLRILAWNARGRAAVVRLFGTREGGAFENVLISVTLAPGHRIERHEFFDVTGAERARARFAELSAPG
ncbi:MAG: hypothetical protein ACREI8_01710, partial [Myxococcota bacterium]